MLDWFAEFRWDVLYAILLGCVLLGGLVFAGCVLHDARKKGVTIVNISNRALDPSSIQALLLTFATLIGGLWVIYEATVTGAHKFQQYQLDRMRLLDTPALQIEMKVNTLGDTMDNGLRQLQVLVEIKNTGVRSIDLDMTRVPLLSIVPISTPFSANSSPFRGAVDVQAMHLPSMKIECAERPDKTNMAKWEPPCNVRTWETGELEPGGSGYFAFLHEGLAPGTYLAQFSLRIPNELLAGPFDPKRPALWSRSVYFSVSKVSGAANDAGPQELR